MDPVRNPFAPVAGHPPPHLAGRASLLDDAHVAMARALIGKPVRAQVLLGGSPLGKTVLLVQIEAMACRLGHQTSRIDVSAGRALSAQLVPNLAALLAGLHRISREQLPVLMVCAGLPVAALAGEAQPNAERLLSVRYLGPIRIMSGGKPTSALVTVVAGAQTQTQTQTQAQTHASHRPATGSAKSPAPGGSLPVATRCGVRSGQMPAR